MDISYIINHLGEERERYFNAVAPPIMQTSNFCFPTVDALRQASNNERFIPMYTRGNNPTTEILCQKLAALDNADCAFVFSSGMAAVTAAVMSNLKAGDHIVCVMKPYSGTYGLFVDYLPRFGVETTFIDGTDAANYEAAIRPNTRILFLESPNTFTFELQDIPAVVAIAKQKGLVTIMDNSFAGLMNPSPILQGVDALVYSATKYHNGHSDVVAGALSCNAEMAERIFKHEYMLVGGVVAPFNAWLMLRGLRTLPIRLEKVNHSTPKIVEFLENHPKVEKVFYPFSKNNPQLELAKKQLTGCNGLFSFQIKAKSIAEVETFCQALKRFLLAVSWGGYESLQLPVCAFYKSNLPFNLIRLSIGLEDADSLIEDLAQALDHI